MSFKKSNIYFDEKPTVGSKNAITSGAVAENSGGIPIYKVEGSFSVYQPNSTAKSVYPQCNITFNTSDDCLDFLNKHIPIGFKVVKAYFDEAMTETAPAAFYNVNQHDTAMASCKFQFISPEVGVRYAGVLGTYRSLTSSSTGTLYFKAEIYFIALDDLTNFE